MVLGKVLMEVKTNPVREMFQNSLEELIVRNRINCELLFYVPSLGRCFWSEAKKFIRLLASPARRYNYVTKWCGDSPVRPMKHWYWRFLHDCFRKRTGLLRLQGLHLETRGEVMRVGMYV